MGQNPGATPPINDPFSRGLLEAYNNDVGGNLSLLDTKGQSGVNLLGVSYIVGADGQARRPLLVNLVNETALRGLKPDEDGSGRNSGPYVYRPIPDSPGYTSKYLSIPAGDIATVALFAGAGAAVGGLIGSQLGNAGAGALILGGLAGGVTAAGIAGGGSLNGGARIGLTTKDAVEASRFSQDFPIRGGALSVINSIDDTLRIGRFLTDAPKGPLFIAKQVALQLSNPKIETGKALGIENTRVYNLGINTLAQTFVNAFGAHVDRPGLFINISDENKYFSIVKNQEKRLNRLILLHKSKITRSSSDFLPATGLREKGISTNDNEIIDYWGGPDSFLGILGNTTIKRAVNTGDLGIKYDAAKSSVVSPTDGEYDPGSRYISFLNSTYQNLQDNSKGTIKEDFRAIINREVAGGRKVLRESDYISGDSKTVKNTGGGISLSPLIRLDNDLEYEELTTQQKDYTDQIKFSFETIDTNNPTTPIVMLFRAYLTNFQDNITADWQSFKYTGRGENFWTYNGFGRTINFGFKVAAESSEELRPLYTKLNYLISNLAPVYDTTFMSGPLIKVTVGDYIYRQPGFFTSLNLSIDDNSSWETNLNQDKDIYQLPHVMNVEVSFTPIHTFLVRRYESAPFITPAGSQNKWLSSPTVRYGQLSPIAPLTPINVNSVPIPGGAPELRTSPSLPIFPPPGQATDTVNNPFNNFG